MGSPPDMQDAIAQTSPVADPPKAAKAQAPTRAAAHTARAELERPFRFIVFDWDGTAVVSRSADATRVVGLLDRLLERGARIAIVTGTKLENVTHQLGTGIKNEN